MIQTIFEYFPRGFPLLRMLPYWVLMCAGGFFMGRTVRRFLPVGQGRLRRLAPYVLFCVAIEMPTWIADENPLFLFPFFLAVFCLSYGGPLLARLSMGLTFFALLTPLSMVVDTLMDDAVSIFLKLTAWCGLFLLARRTVPANTVHLPNRLWALTGALALAPVFAILSFSIWGGYWTWHLLRGDLPFDFDEIVKPVAYTILPFVLLAAVAILCAVIVLSRHEELEREHRLAEMREVYYQSLQREQTQVRVLRHDLANHLTALHGLLEQGHTAQARAYLDELVCSPALSGGRRICENDTANAVFASKLDALTQAGLVADFAAALPQALPLAASDLTALLGNALDNAIEAAASASDKRIRLRARADKGMLMLRVENAYAGERHGQNGAFATTKTDARAHGLGLSGMREIASRCGGTLDARAENGRFELIVCLPLSEKNA